MEDETDGNIHMHACYTMKVFKDRVKHIGM